MKKLCLSVPMLWATLAFQPTVATGEAISKEDLGYSIEKIEGWDVKENKQSNLLMMIKPETNDPKSPDYYDLKMQKKMTVAVRPKAQPVDEKRIQELKAEIKKQFNPNTNPSITSEVQFNEAKLIDYRPNRKAIFLDMSMYVGKHLQRQMITVVSNDRKEYVMTYADLEKNFKNDNPNFSNAWNSMMSIEVGAESPKRYEDTFKVAAGAGVVVMLFSMFGFIARRKSNKLILNAERQELADDSDIDSYSNFGFSKNESSEQSMDSSWESELVSSHPVDHEQMKSDEPQSFVSDFDF